jgi:hypothetical protein
VVWTPIEARDYAGVKVQVLLGSDQADTNPDDNESELGTITVAEAGGGGGDGPDIVLSPKVFTKIKRWKIIKTEIDPGFIRFFPEVVSQ